MARKIQTVQTHNGLFHADEVFGCALMRIIYPDINIIRSREINQNADIFIDVGGHFDNHTFFDHHFREFNEFHFKEGIPKASFGLVYEKFIPELINSEQVINTLRNQIVIPIDAHDNNIKIENCIYKPYTVSNIISAFNSKNIYDNNNEFNKALEFAITILENAIKQALEFYQVDEKTQYIFDSSLDKDYVVLDSYQNFNAVLFKDPEKYSNIKYVIYGEHDHFRAIALKDHKTNDLKKPFPSDWTGLDGSALVAASGIDNAIFCHRNGFLAANKTLDGMITMVEKSLEIN